MSGGAQYGRTNTFCGLVAFKESWHSVGDGNLSAVLNVDVCFMPKKEMREKEEKNSENIVSMNAVKPTPNGKHGKAARDYVCKWVEPQGSRVRGHVAPHPNWQIMH